MRFFTRKVHTRDPAVIERSNLVNISKLVVKELIETSLKYGRMLDSDHMPLQHFFIVLEHVLRHGLKPKKGILGPKKELWDILQMVEKYATEAQDITASVRDLPTVSTHMGRARAWLRLALMQKKLADYLKVLVDHKEDVLSEYYEPEALLMSDEAIVIVGLLVGLNVIDCNLCVKEEDLDCPQGVIDFSLYLRSSHHLIGGDNGDCKGDNEDGSAEDGENHMTAVLDQKNYIEELNRHLNATVTNLQSKVESLTATNALMKEDLAIAKNTILSLHEENCNLRKEIGHDVHSERIDEGGGADNSNKAKDSNDNLKQQMESEKKQRMELQKELDLQISLKAEMEVAMKLLEKDIHEKQDTIVSLRSQLDDIKLINLEMYKKLQECESSLKHKTELINKLETKTSAMADTIQKVDEKREDNERVCHTLEEKCRLLCKQLSETEERARTVEGELKLEREIHSALRETSIRDKEQLSLLSREVSQLKSMAAKYHSLQEEQYTLRERCREQEQTLEELGAQLSDSKLRLADMQEEAAVAAAAETTSVPVMECGPTSVSGAPWASDKATSRCNACSKEFRFARRKHHCRYCGEIFCGACSDNTIVIPSNGDKAVRVCDKCYLVLVGRLSVLP
ncbi:RUN and FYVE domain-containing protein 2 isoform X3 [Ischnura elegans]|uniref:RUN and FYVE domain-containing protein 2 isoform X3 n=1 Tax=Ischnura elegans TaxID=197161 RepID=UPI001ED8928C|nr:RUN and FYVE domain-containing protein 2 isoform X3 [Ischnura elegans]